MLHKYDCAYFFCDDCGFLQTEEPYWLDEAYTRAIADADSGLVRRNLDISRKLSALLFLFFDRNGRYLDFAGGYGMLTRMMRDIGFDFYWRDKYAENLLAPGFSASDAIASFTAVTAFEVLEHVSDPLDFVAEALQSGGSRTLIFSTETFAGKPPQPGEWWYYVPETGQHISFYQARTLARIAKHHSLNFYSNAGMHIFTDQHLTRAAFSLLSRPAFVSLLYPLFSRMMKSKTQADHVYLKSRFDKGGC